MCLLSDEWTDNKKTGCPVKPKMSLLLCLLVIASAPANTQDGSSEQREVDQYSFRLGAAAAFSEMVSFGNKKLALSSAVSPEEMEELRAGYDRVISEQGAMATLEPELIVTDLFRADIAVGLHVLLIYKQPSVLEEYRTLKDDKAALVASANYTGEARANIARRFGRLLSYPDATIEEKIRTNPKKEQ